LYCDTRTEIKRDWKESTVFNIDSQAV
jgi:hypothetical protein